MKNPYLLDAPAVIAFSGGRTSGLLLRRVLDAHLAEREAAPVAVFCNTGKERPETLDFVREVEERWAVPVVWLEYRYDSPVPCPTRRADYAALSLQDRSNLWHTWAELMRPIRQSGRKCKHSFALVTHASASRAGEPFEEVIAARSYLPNRMSRFCTAELKVKTMWRWAAQEGLSKGGYTKAVGLRADEQGRVQRLLAGTGEKRASESLCCPLSEGGVTLGDVTEFWAGQPFDLRLRPEEGNCDLCFLKRKGVILSLMSERPDLAEWWVAQEREGRLFRSSKDRPRYSLLMAQAKQPTLFDQDEDDDPSNWMECACTD